MREHGAANPCRCPVRPHEAQSRPLVKLPLNNVALPPLSGTNFDLIDRNGNCNVNQWYGNVYGTAFPDCVKAGGQQHVNNT